MNRTGKAAAAAAVAVSIGRYDHPRFVAPGGTPPPAPSPALPTPARPVTERPVTDEALAAADAHRRSPVVDKKEITQPGEAMDFAVFHNGKFHWVKVKTKTFDVTHADGTKGGQVVPDPAGPSMEAQLPPRDARFDHVSPTPEQEAEARRIIGPPVPPGHRKG